MHTSGNTKVVNNSEDHFVISGNDEQLKLKIVYSGDMRLTG